MHNHELLQRLTVHFSVLLDYNKKAWRFDRKSVALEERWSNLQFEEFWVDAMVIWTVKKNVGNRWLLKWDIDEETVSWETEYFSKEDPTRQQDVVATS